MLLLPLLLKGLPLLLLALWPTTVASAAYSSTMYQAGLGFIVASVLFGIR